MLPHLPTKDDEGLSHQEEGGEVEGGKDSCRKANSNRKIGYSVHPVLLEVHVLIVGRQDGEDNTNSSKLWSQYQRFVSTPLCPWR